MFHITLAPKKLILTRRASEGSASEPSLARRVSMCKDAKLSCRGNRRQFTIRAQWLSFVVGFIYDVLEVDAELSLAAKTFATQTHRQNAVRFIDSIATDLGL